MTSTQGAGGGGLLKLTSTMVINNFLHNFVKLKRAHASTFAFRQFVYLLRLRSNVVRLERNAKIFYDLPYSHLKIKGHNLSNKCAK